MASWMVHLRVGDYILNNTKGLEATEFIVGTIAPDSGIPNEDYSSFTPSSEVSHFKMPNKDGLKDIQLEQFLNLYFTKQKYDTYDKKQKSFFMGYFVHLLTDIEWSEGIVRQGREKFKELYNKDRNEWVWAMKKDWYDLDFLYLKKHPNFHGFCIYENAVGFLNKYLDFFSIDAFDHRRKDITEFYRNGREGLEREYPYLTEVEMDCFVKECSIKIHKIILKEYFNKNSPVLEKLG